MASAIRTARHSNNPIRYEYRVNVIRYDTGDRPMFQIRVFDTRFFALITDETKAKNRYINQ